MTKDGTYDFRLDVTTVVPEEPTAPAYPWIPDNHYEDNITAFAQIQINGVPVTSTNWEVGPFCGNQCRGDTKQLTEIPNLGIICFLTIRGVAGDVINFYLYDTENSEVHPGICSTTITYGNSEGYGTPQNPIILNFVFTECFTLPISAWTATGGFYFISSPIGEISPEDVENMIPTESGYDLYYFEPPPQDEIGLEWINYKGSNGGFNMEVGKGYLYANETGAELKFCGHPYSGDGIVTLEKKEGVNAEFSGWNLVGNPYAVTAYIDRPFYTMNPNGSEVIPGEGNTIAPMTGLFVIAETDGKTMTFSTQETNEGGKIVLSIKQDRGNVIDRAIVSINGSRTLPKFMLNEHNTKLYIPQGSDDYAVIAANSEIGELPVNFKPAQNGVYTLSVDVKNAEFEHLTLIDNVTGTHVNLLNTPNYQFNGNTTDIDDRFTISFKSNSSIVADENINPISYCQEGKLIIKGLEGESELQLIDMLGRIISSTTIKGEYSSNLNVVPGMYMIRLITTNNTYTQKVVVD